MAGCVLNQRILVFQGTDWAGGVYKVTMEFSEDYPSKVIEYHHCPKVYCRRWVLISFSLVGHVAPEMQVCATPLPPQRVPLR